MATNFGAIAGCHCDKKLTRVLHHSPLHLSLHCKLACAIWGLCGYNFCCLFDQLNNRRLKKTPPQEISPFPQVEDVLSEANKNDVGNGFSPWNGWTIFFEKMEQEKSSKETQQCVCVFFLVLPFQTWKFFFE